MIKILCFLIGLKIIWSEVLDSSRRFQISETRGQDFIVPTIEDRSDLSIRHFLEVQELG